MTAPVQVGPSPSGGGPVPSLSAREFELLERVAEGESYRQIAKDWVVAEITVRTTGFRVMRKLGANNITHAVFIGCRIRILDPRRRHGDHAGFAAHVYRDEDPCDECWDGERAYRRGAKAARKAAKSSAA